MHETDELSLSDIQREKIIKTLFYFNSLWFPIRPRNWNVLIGQKGQSLGSILGMDYRP